MRRSTTKTRPRSDRRRRLWERALSTLALTKDTSIRLSAPNKNFGSVGTLDINRGLIEVQAEELATLVGNGDHLISAKLEFTLVPNDERRRQVAREVSLNRLLKPWTESGATWLCSNDTNPGNSRPDCAGTSAWNMVLNSGTFVAQASSTATIPASRTGVVSFDVTEDLRGFVAAPATNFGWLIKAGAGLLEIADFASAESATPPRLVVELRHCDLTACNDGNACTTDSCSAVAECVHSAVEGLACGSDAHMVVNEVESNGGTPGDWVELYNAGPTTADVSGWRFKDNDNSHAFYVIPANTQIPAGGFLILEEAQFGFGLGGAESARLYLPTGDEPVETYSWTAHATTTYGRCPDGTGSFKRRPP